MYSRCVTYDVTYTFALAACFKIIKEDESNIIPAGMAELFGTDVQRQATRGHRPSMITIANQCLRRIDPFALKEGMPLLLDMPTDQLQSLIVEPDKLLHFLRQKGLKPIFDPPSHLKLKITTSNSY